MGLRIVLEVHQADNVVFTDLAKLNEALAKTSIGELFQYSNPEDVEDFTGFIKMQGNELLLAGNFDGYWEGYGTSCQVWSCFGDEEAQTIADYLKSGKIVFHKDIEGNPDEYWVITPQTFKLIVENELKF